MRSKGREEPRSGLDPTRPSAVPECLAALHDSRTVRWYVLTLPVCHRGPAPGLRQELERRRRCGETEFEYFAPTCLEVRREGGRLVNTQRPLLYNYVFIRSSEQELYRLKRQLPQYNFLPRIRDARGDYYPYLSDATMKNLQWVARAYSERLPVYLPEQAQLMKGDRVLITAGRFQGAEARIAVQPGAGHKELIVCVENWMWVPLLRVHPGEYEVIELSDEGKRRYTGLDNDRLMTGLHEALLRHLHGTLTDDDRALASEALRLCGKLTPESDVLRSKQYALLLPAYTLLTERETRDRLLATIRNQLPHVKAEQARAMLLVTLYGCTGNPDYGRQAHEIADRWRAEGSSRKSKLRLIRWLEEYDTWLSDNPAVSECGQ